jgi:nitrogen regulatory protein PII
MVNLSIVKTTRREKMEIVFKVEKQNLQKVKDVLLKDEKVSRASVLFKESSSLGLEGDEYFCYISGLEEACERAKELMKDLGEVVNEEDMKKIINKIKEEEESAMTGFGNIFG